MQYCADSGRLILFWSCKTGAATAYKPSIVTPTLVVSPPTFTVPAGIGVLGSVPTGKREVVCVCVAKVLGNLTFSYNLKDEQFDLLSA